MQENTSITAGTSPRYELFDTAVNFLLESVKISPVDFCDAPQMILREYKGPVIGLKSISSSPRTSKETFPYDLSESNLNLTT